MYTLKMHFKRIVVSCGSLTIFITFVLILYANSVALHYGAFKNDASTETKDIIETEDSQVHHNEITKSFYDKRKGLKLSILGEYLFKNGTVPKQKDETFKILIWKDGVFLERRHLRHFTNTRHDPLEDCSVKNCVFTYKSEDLASSNAVAFLLHRLKFEDLPNSSLPRPQSQRWIFITDESPHNTFMYRGKWQSYANIFNWSMTYKVESDIPVPYGRAVSLKKEIALGSKSALSPEIMNLVPFNEEKQRDVLVAAMISNCGKNNGRLNYIKELQKYIQVDLYGSCGTTYKNACNHSFGVDCPSINKYLFYLSFENSNCDQYYTEKVFWNAYSKGAVPIIMGPKPEYCRLMLPPESFINVWDYARPVDLARHVLFLNATGRDEFFKMHSWRKNFQILNEHGYDATPSYHYCRICEALNYNDPKPKTYTVEDLSTFLDPDINCYQLPK